MLQGFDQFSKNLLRDALSRAADANTEVEVLADTQRIDVYCVPDPARAGERQQMGLLGKLCAIASLFEPFGATVSLAAFRRCLNKQLSWHHELQRRARSRSESSDAVPFPVLIILSPGRPETVLADFGFRSTQSGLYDTVRGLATRVIVISELPRVRETLLLRMLGSGKVREEALDELAALPADAWEQRTADPLLVHFAMDRLANGGSEDEMSPEIQAWYDDYVKKQEARVRAAFLQGRQENLTRQLVHKFGPLPEDVAARLAAATSAELDSWSERLLTASLLREVFATTH